MTLHRTDSFVQLGLSPSGLAQIAAPAKEPVLWREGGRRDVRILSLPSYSRRTARADYAQPLGVLVCISYLPHILERPSHTKGHTRAALASPGYHILRVVIFIAHRFQEHKTIDKGHYSSLYPSLPFH
ncbi:hypothetical protein V2G26_015389 [Clonostachys chloroleuca]